MKTDDTLPFDLSLDELHWLAGAFGIATLPLPDHAQADNSRVQLIERQKKGHASLLRRGLIQPSLGFGWQVDRLPAAIVQWMASADSMLRVERIEKEGGKKVMHVFTSSGQALSLEFADETAHFMLHKTRANMNDSLNVWLMLPPKPVKSKKIFSIPQPQAFIPVAWKDPQLAARILHERGIDAKQTKSALAFSASLEWIAAISKVKLDGRNNSIVEQVVLCGGGKLVWGGEDDVSFVPMTVKGLSAKIGELLN